ncbi:MAG: cyclic pyranopterin monophosphate synthase MoaC [Chloroflexota bacterium]|nr:cyclic pyranopterin monophosphate synthase MoaC [Chloroflexota bacterium]MDE2885515.1 cyclic pyranopterin monophosphate synthase MoaC [Chloroflexota bacterium]
MSGALSGPRSPGERAGVRADGGLTHIDPHGNARMVDVGGKPDSVRTAVAAGAIAMRPDTLSLIVEGRAEKGDVFTVARIAGINAAKHTWELIPLAHQVPLSHVSVDFEAEPGTDVARVLIRAQARTTAKTGVEMEALTAVSAAALTVYDMCKAVDRGMTIEGVRLVEKTGGTHGDYRAPA